MTVKRYGTGLNGRIEEMECGAFTGYAEYSALLKERDALAAESAGVNAQMQQLIQIINNADNSYCMCGEEMEKHTYAGCGHPTGMFDYHYNKWLESSNETPATDAAIANIQAQGVKNFIGRIEWVIRNECNHEVTERILAGLSDFSKELHKVECDAK